MNFIPHNRPSVEGTKPLRVLVAILLLVATPWPGCDAILCCSVCACRGREAWCEERGLTEVPSNIPEDLRRLYLFNNNITTIADGTFSKLKHLELLDLRSNALDSSAIKPGLLNGFPLLHDLLLSDNKISRISRNSFSGLTSLVRLYLERNQVEFIEDQAFSGLGSLLELKLSHNRLVHFPRISNTTNLRRLYLNGNRLVRLQSEVLSQVNLEQLALSRNHLNQLPSIVFGRVSNMRELDLSGNRISSLPRIISRMTSLQTLNMSGNPIAVLPHTSLSGLRRMKVLDISSLRLTSLMKGFIPRRVYLNVLDVSSNPWNCDCSLSWLMEYMRIVRGAFVRMSQVRCDAPLPIRGRQLVTVREGDLNCERPATEDLTASSTALTTTTCDNLACANGANCFIDPRTQQPRCRCLTGWTGSFCNRRVPTSSTSTASTPEEGGGRLFIQRDTITPHSVDIRFSSSGKRMRISATEITGDGIGWSSSKSFLPSTSAYTVDSLKPETKYEICISALDTDDIEHCETIVTSGLSAEPDSKGIATAPKSRNNRPEDEESNQSKFDLDGTAEKARSSDEDFDLLYPVIGACVAVCLIVASGILLFICNRKRNRRKYAGDTEVIHFEPNSKNERFCQFTVEESLPMVGNVNNNAAPGQILDTFPCVDRCDRQEKCCYAFSERQPQKEIDFPALKSSNKFRTLNEGNLKCFLSGYQEQEKCFYESGGTLPSNRNCLHHSALPPPNVPYNSERPFEHSVSRTNNQRQDWVYKQPSQPDYQAPDSMTRCISGVHVDGADFVSCVSGQQCNSNERGNAADGFVQARKQNHEKNLYSNRKPHNSDALNTPHFSTANTRDSDRTTMI